MFSKRAVLNQIRPRATLLGLQHVRRSFAACSGPLLQKTSPLDPGLEMPKCDYEPQPYQGITFEHAKEVRKSNLNPALFTYYKNPVFICKGRMQWLWDSDGKRYLDMFAGLVTVSVGHCHPRVTEAAKKQLDNLWHTTNIYYHPTIHEYAELMASKFPGNLKVGIKGLGYLRLTDLLGAMCRIGRVRILFKRHSDLSTAFCAASFHDFHPKVLLSLSTVLLQGVSWVN
ncbi:alanine--glyoxylate aminotransferase 2 [Desmophyllum pertusum]|uniref:Alanine--glyoxylate aminotransferase 2, mitochondrial n=1 Tax=Desmophyllum pertusum TaxID=174260 RepID=A0A9X0D0E6_9CNID|nr:alanine--glyoxylate aminotransferase 2 [Desmophyllum pertusum]